VNRRKTDCVSRVMLCADQVTLLEQEQRQLLSGFAMIGRNCYQSSQHNQRCVLLSGASADKVKNPEGRRKTGRCVQRLQSSRLGGDEVAVGERLKRAIAKNSDPLHRLRCHGESGIEFAAATAPQTAATGAQRTP
jgi:hypothetical protein